MNVRMIFNIMINRCAVYGVETKHVCSFKSLNALCFFLLKYYKSCVFNWVSNKKGDASGLIKRCLNHLC